MSPRFWTKGLQILAAFTVVVMIAWYVHYRSNIHKEAPQFSAKFIDAIATRWAFEDINPFLSSSLQKRRSRESWEKLLSCYGQLGAIESHSQPGTSDVGLFGRVMYFADGRFEHGDATIYLWIDKYWGRVVVDEIYVSGPEFMGFGDHSWCRTGPGRRQATVDGSS